MDSDTHKIRIIIVKCSSEKMYNIILINNIFWDLMFIIKHAYYLMLYSNILFIDLNLEFNFTKKKKSITDCYNSKLKYNLF